jgi:hypothetical protein
MHKGARVQRVPAPEVWVCVRFVRARVAGVLQGCVASGANYVLTYGPADNAAPASATGATGAARKGSQPLVAARTPALSTGAQPGGGAGAGGRATPQPLRHKSGSMSHINTEPGGGGGGGSPGSARGTISLAAAAAVATGSSRSLHNLRSHSTRVLPVSPTLSGGPSSPSRRGIGSVAAGREVLDLTDFELGSVVGKGGYAVVRIALHVPTSRCECEGRACVRALAPPPPVCRCARALPPFPRQRTCTARARAWSGRRYMALKVISKARAHAKGSVPDMVDEKRAATAMTDMDHPFVVRFFGSFQVCVFVRGHCVCMGMCVRGCACVYLCVREVRVRTCLCLRQCVVASGRWEGGGACVCRTCVRMCLV